MWHLRTYWDSGYIDSIVSRTYWGSGYIDSIVSRTYWGSGYIDSIVSRTMVHESPRRIQNGGQVPLMTVLDLSLAPFDGVTERDSRVTVTNEMGSDISIDRGISRCKNGFRSRRAHVNMAKFEKLFVGPNTQHPLPSRFRKLMQ
jgi:hypothetical protein